LLRMVTRRRIELATILRQRLRLALQIGALAPGDRLPSTRALAREFAADPRVVASAYRELAAAGLVELRPRAGTYVHRSVEGSRTRPRPSTAWIADVYLAGIARGVPAPELPAVLRRALGRPPFPVAVIATTLDQTAAMCWELERFLGLAATGVLADTLPRIEPSMSSAASRASLPRAVKRARVLVTTEAHSTAVAALATLLRRPLVTVTVRRELVDTEATFLRGLQVYVLVLDQRFAALLQDYVRGLDLQLSVRVLVVGDDDMTRIPADAPVYATQAARERLGVLHLPPGLLPYARVMSDDGLNAILREILRIARMEVGSRPSSRNADG
jgi:DNA-binding transcriptional regulator YhcF (GntR family)